MVLEIEWITLEIFFFNRTVEIGVLCTRTDKTLTCESLFHFLFYITVSYIGEILFYFI